jgi:tRNA A-37 threonylcarbamoyl transferase component Bud32
MPHGWRLPARSTASPRACATDPAIPAAIAGAVVDRTAIDWDALLARVRDPRDRAPLEALRRLDGLRGPQSPAGVPPGRDFRIFLLRLLVALAALQTIWAMARGAAAIWSGGSLGPLGPLGPPLLITAAFASAGLMLASASARDRRVLLLLATFTFAASAFARAVLIGLAGSPAASGLLFRGLFPEAFVPAALWQFTVFFPAVQRFTRFDVWARRAATAVWVLASFLFIANFAARHGWLVRLLEPLGRDHRGNLFWHVFVAASLPAFSAIFIRAHRAPPVERDKAVRFGYALAAGAAPFLLAGLARLALPGVDRWMLTGSGIGRLAVDLAIVGALAAMPILATLAVIVDRPFELYAILPARLRQWLAGSGMRFSAAAHTGLLRRRRRREWLTAALERVRLARGSREIANVVCRELQFGVKARTLVVLVAGDLPRDWAVRAMLEASSGPIALTRNAEPFVLLPARERAWVEAHDVALAAPIRLRDGALAGVALVGPLRDGATYGRTDRWFISTLLTGAGAAWDVPETPRGREEPAFECERCGLVWHTAPVPCLCDAAAMPASLPRRLAGKFEAVRRLGAGGMGVVYLARDLALGRDVALKTLPALRDGSVARLRDEARAMAALNHGSLATIYGLEVWRRTPVIVVEYFAGGTLADRLVHGPLPQADILALGIRLADGLRYMHERGLLHRDVKSSNIGLTSDGVSKLLDFGLSGDAGTPAGTPAYLPPEALDGAAPDTAVDLWGLCTVLLEAGGGQRGELAAFFERALAPAREPRFQSAADIREALLRLQRQRGDVL